jgi:small conductance mechanosensitive channel
MEDISWLSIDFWKGVVESSVRWAIETGPRLLLIALLAFILLRVLRAALNRTEKRLLRRSRDDAAALGEYQKRVETLIGITRKVGFVTVLILVGLIVLLELGVNVGPLLAGAGVIGLAIGFGAQELVRDVISGSFNLIENHIRTGDVAVINGTGGLVESIGLRTIVLRDLSGVVHVFQNGKIDTIANMTKEWSAMVFDVGVAYKEDTDHVTRVMEKVAGELRADEACAKQILEPLEIFGVDAFDDSAVVVKARFKTVPMQQWAVGREYRRRLKRAFDEEGIEIPFPHRTLVWGSESAVVPVSGSERALGYSQPGEPGSAAHRSSQHDAKQPAGLAPEESSTRSHNTPASPSSAGSTVKAAR